MSISEKERASLRLRFVQSVRLLHRRAVHLVIFIHGDDLGESRGGVRKRGRERVRSSQYVII